MKGGKSSEDAQEQTGHVHNSEEVSAAKVETEKVVAEMHAEFGRRRKITVSGLPVDFTEESFKTLLSNQDFIVASKIKDDTIKLVFPTLSDARTAIQELNGLKTDGQKLSSQFGHPDSFLFVGNLPQWYDKTKLHTLFSPYGTILRCFVVYSIVTGESKNYGFVEFLTREEAMAAKQKMATKVVGSRSLRVDFADNGMQTCEDLHSKTLFVDKLPKGLKDESKLKEMFEECGTVNFCQIALTATGMPRGFAFIDMSTSKEAEEGQRLCNHKMFEGQEIRVSFGMPCRPGACILQPKNVPFNTLWSTNIVPSSLGVICPQEKIFISTYPSDHTYAIAPSTHFTTGPIYTSVNTSTLPTSSSHILIPITAIPTTHHPHIHLHNHLPTSQQSETPPPESSELKENVPVQEKTSHKIGQKRHLHEDNDTNYDKDSLMAVYDRPYLGQHDQGIQYTHPLKRIRTME